jgi:hypothetical protein
MDKTSNLPQNPSWQQTSIKCRFFAQYWGQKVMYVGGVGLVEVGARGWNLKHPDFFLELKPLSKITKNDLEKIGFRNIGDKKVSFVFDNYNYNWTSSCGNYGTLLLKDIDYLRSKGYALPFMKYSVDELVELGWVRLV